MKNKVSKKIKILVCLQCIVILYTLSGVMAKFASGHSFLSTDFLLFYCIEILILAFYAIFWQQIIKHVDLSIAYANRSIALLWSMIWAIIFFQETVTIKNIIGVIVVIIGTTIVNKEYE